VIWTFFGVTPVSPDDKYVVLQDANGK